MSIKKVLNEVKDNLMTTQSNNKRIAKNTLLLYFRMAFLMLVNLYTSRVILNALGVEDFGIYNVVGGVVAMFSIISGSLSSAISRFITFELGKGNLKNLNKIFSASINIQLILAILISVLAETIGTWFLNVKMTIPPDRIIAANWVFQFSIITFAINLISVPYNAVIIAHEKMAAFAYIGILEALGKLGVAFLIVLSPIDKLVFYALLMCIVAVIIRFLYGWYCKKHFEECIYRFYRDTDILKKMIGFAGWSFIGASANVLRDQGVNVIINLFCGPIVNAAKGISNQVNNAVSSFVQSFMTALNPQITKNYAVGNKEYMFRLMFQGARYSYYLLLIITLPILINTEFVLKLWLRTVPEYAAVFVQLILILALLESLSYPLITAMQATGNIKKYQIMAGGCNLLNFPLSYIALKMGCEPYTTLYIAIVVALMCLIIRLYLLRGMIGLPIKDFMTKVCLNILYVSVISIIISYLANLRFEINLYSFVIVSFISIVFSILTILFIGCSSNERNIIYKAVISKIHG